MNLEKDVLHNRLVLIPREGEYRTPCCGVGLPCHAFGITWRRNVTSASTVMRVDGLLYPAWASWRARHVPVAERRFTL